MNPDLLETSAGTDPPGQSSRWLLVERRWFSLLALALLPFMLVLINDNWSFTGSQVGFIDPWLYTSYFLHLKAQLLAFPGAYYGDRLSSSLPGWTIYHIFGPWIGNYVLKLVIIWTASFATYAIARRLLGQRAALISGLLVGAQPHFLMAFGWDYVDGLGIAYFALSTLFVVRAAQSKSYGISMLIAGALCNCLITSHFLWLNLAWIIPLAFLLINRLERRHNLWKSLAMFTVGFALVFVIFCGVHYAITGRWFYLANSLRHTLTGFGAAQKVNNPIAMWISLAIWLVHYNGLIFIAAWRLLPGRSTPKERVCLALFVVSYVTIWGWQAVGFPFVMFLYYTSFLFPVYSLSLGAILNHYLTRLSPGRFTIVVAFSLIVGLALYVHVPLWRLMGDFSWLAPRLLVTRIKSPLWLWLLFHPMWPISLLCILITLIFITRRSKAFSSTMVFVLGMFLVYALQLAFMQDQGWFFSSSNFTNKQAFRVILDADAWADRLTTKRRLMWWTDINGGYGHGVVRGLTSLYLWGWTGLNESMPELPAADERKLSAAIPLLLVSVKDDNFERARQTLAARNWSVAREHSTVISDGSLHLYLKLWKVVSGGSATEEFFAKEGLRELPGVLSLDTFHPGAPWIPFQRDSVVRVAVNVPAWSYVAQLPLALPPGPDEFWLRVRARVVKGQVGFGILKRDRSDFYDRKFFNEGEDPEDFVLHVAHPRDSSELIVQSGDKAGEASVIIEKVSLYVRTP